MVVQVDRHMGSELAEASGLAGVLWREREALQLVLFKLSVERLVVSAAEARWLPDANRELEAALEQLHNVEVVRAIESDALAEQLDMVPGATLAQLADAVSEPWATILADHRTAALE